MNTTYWVRGRCFLLYVLIIFFQLTACAEQNQTEKQPLLYWSSNNPDEIIFADQIVKTWNSQHPDSGVFSQPVPEGRSSEEVILAAVVGGTTPDIYSNMWQGDVEFFARSGVLVPLDTISGFMTFLNQRCDSAVIAEITSDDGHIYQVPWKINPIMLLYNVNMFKDIGWKQPPKTYTDFLSAGKLMQKDTDGDGYIDRWVGYSTILVTWWQRFFDFYPLYLGASNGGKLIKQGKVVFNNQDAIDVFRFLQTVYRENFFTKELLNARQDVFLSEIIATRFVGPWEIIHTEKFKPKGFDYAYTNLPVPDNHQGNIYTYGDPKNIVIFNTCDNPNKAWQFIRFMINDENDYELLEITTQIPRRKALKKNPRYIHYLEKNPKMIPFIEQADYVKGTDVCAQLKEVFDIISQEYEACVIYDTKSAEKAIEDAANAAQVILN